MLRVALTGGIATGKTHVLELMRRKGVPCLDADELAHGVMTPGAEATTAIAAHFGPSLLDGEGAVDRKQLGQIVFADAAARRALEAIVHPAVYRAITVGLRAFELVGGSVLAVADVPLLFESGHASDFDRVIATTCSATHQLERLRQRGLTDVEAQQRIAAQMPVDEKARRADYVISTDGTFEETEAQLDDVLKSLIARAKSGPTS